MRITRRRALVAVGAATLAIATGCGSTGGDGGDSGGGSEGESSKPIKVGLLIPQSGVYATIGKDMRAGWEAWLAAHDNKIGGRSVETVIADEGEGPETGVPALQRLVQRDQVDVLVGIVSSAVALGAADVIDRSKTLTLVANAGANDITAQSKYIWRPAFTNQQVDYAVGEWLGKSGGAKKVFTLAPDYAAGVEHIAGFTAGFEANGGKIVGNATTPFGTTQDFQPYLGRVRRSGADAAYVFYAGAEAVTFVKQYDQFGLKNTTPLYSTGFLTEGGVLAAQGKSAMGIETVLHYSTTLDNPANQDFLEAYKAKSETPPTVFSVQAWDSAEVLHRAVEDAQNVESDALISALENLGPIDNSPRGEWEFEEQEAKQHMYRRQVVEGDDGKPLNEVKEDLGVYAPFPGGR